MIHFETAIEIARPRDEVFAYVADPSRFAEWNVAVDSVTALPGSETGGEYVMQRRLPGGPATNRLVITTRPPDELTIRTTTGPTPFEYRYTFEPTATGTLVKLSADVQLGRGASLLGPLAAQAVKRGVDANLGALRDILEPSPRPERWR